MSEPNGQYTTSRDHFVYVASHRETTLQCHALIAWLCFYQTKSAWSVDQGSNKNHSPAYNFAPTVTKFCVMWEGLSLPHDTKFGNCRCTIVDSRAFLSWSLIHGLRWSGLIKAEPGHIHRMIPTVNHTENLSKQYHTLNQGRVKKVKRQSYPTDS